MHVGPFREHQIEFVVDSGPTFTHGRRIRDGAYRRILEIQATAGNHKRRLVIYADFEPGGAPIHEFDHVGFHVLSGGYNLSGLHFTAVEHADGHVSTSFRVAFQHLMAGLEALFGEMVDLQLGVGAVGQSLNGGVGYEREVDTRVGYQIGAKFGHVDVNGTVEAQRCGHSGHNLGDYLVQVDVGWRVHVEVAAADVIKGFVVDHKNAVAGLECAVG